MAIRFDRYAWALVLPLLVLATPCLAQQEGAQEPPPIFRSRSDVVLVDVTATDKKGNFVRDLRPDEIQVLEGGKEQSVTFFALQRRAGPGDPAPDKAQTSVPLAIEGQGTSPRIPPVNPGHFVFLLDLQSMSFSSLARTKDSIRDFAHSELGPQDQMMLASIQPKFLVDLPMTRDVSKLEEALDGIVYDLEEMNLADFAYRIDEIFERFEGAPDPDGAIHMAANEARRFLGNLRLRLDLAVNAISALSRQLATLPGRKHILFFSNGYPINAGRIVEQIIGRREGLLSPGQIDPLAQRGARIRQLMPAGTGRVASLMGRLRVAVDAANRAHVSVYTIDPRGVLLAPDQDLLGVYTVGDLESPREFLASLSKQTGGLMFADANDLLEPIREAHRDSREYYLLGYVPTTSREVDKFYEIEVKVKRKGMRVRHRSGYTFGDPVKLANADLANAFKFPDAFRDFPFELRVIRKKEKLEIRILVSTVDIVFATHEGKHRCLLEMVGALMDESGQLVGEELLFVKQVDLDFDTEGLERFLSYERFGPSVELNPPGRVDDMVVVVRQIPSGRMSTASHLVTVEQVASSH